MAEITLDFTPRPQQQTILDFVKRSIERDKKFTIIDAPTGVGKSYAAVMIADWYRKEINEKARIDIITNTKILQDQYIRDFKFAANIKGKNNYWCKRHNTDCGDASYLNKANNSTCRVCPHRIAQSHWIKSPLSLTTVSYTHLTLPTKRIV